MDSKIIVSIFLIAFINSINLFESKPVPEWRPPSPSNFPGSSSIGQFANSGQNQRQAYTDEQQLMDEQLRQLVEYQYQLQMVKQFENLGMLDELPEMIKNNRDRLT